MALLAVGTFASVEEAQQAMCLKYRTILPEPDAVAVYENLFRNYRNLYFALGSRDAKPASLGEVLPELRRIASVARRA
jgi:L-ribulokinase